jgi:hypothetical protein
MNWTSRAKVRHGSTTLCDDAVLCLCLRTSPSLYLHLHSSPYLRLYLYLYLYLYLCLCLCLYLLYLCLCLSLSLSLWVLSLDLSLLSVTTSSTSLYDPSFHSLNPENLPPSRKASQDGGTFMKKNCFAHLSDNPIYFSLKRHAEFFPCRLSPCFSRL